MRADEDEVACLPCPVLRRNKRRNVVEQTLPLHRGPSDLLKSTVDILNELGMHPLLPYPRGHRKASVSALLP